MKGACGVSETDKVGRCRVCGFTIAGELLIKLREDGVHRNANHEPRPNVGVGYCPICDDETLVEALFTDISESIQRLRLAISDLDDEDEQGIGVDAGDIRSVLGALLACANVKR